MANIVLIKTQALKNSNSLLLNWIETCVNKRVITESFSIDLEDSKLSPGTHNALIVWLNSTRGTGVWRYDLPAPAAPEPTPQTPTEPQIDIAEIEREQKIEVQCAVHRAEAENRLAEFEKVGLIRDEHNLGLITEFVNNSETHGYWSAQIVDIAIQYLRARLNWRVVQAPPPPPPPPQPAPSYFVEGEVCSDGQPRLRIDIEIPQRVQKNCTPAQLRDLVQRSSPEWTKGFRDSSRAGRAREDRMPSHRVNF